jgi:Uma2 family endonuclease
MAQLRLPQTTLSRTELRYVRAPQPIDFPEEEEVPEGFAHLVVRTFLFRLLSFALGSAHTVASDQFVYWDASNSKRRLSPDVFVRLNHPQPAKLGSWQTWTGGGAPDLAVEIVSPNEGDGLPWEEKLARYHQLGVSELVRFDPEALEGKRLRVWDRVGGDLVERQIGADRTPCLTLGLAWTVRAVPAPNGTGEYLGLRLVDDEGRLLEAPEEAAARARAEATKGLRGAIIRVLGARSLPLSDLGQAKLASCTDVATLTRWLERAATARAEAVVFAADEIP